MSLGDRATVQDYRGHRPRRIVPAGLLPALPPASLSEPTDARRLSGLPEVEALCDRLDQAIALIDEQRDQIVTLRAERDEARHALSHFATRIQMPSVKNVSAVLSTGLKCQKCGEPFDPDPKHPWGRTCPLCTRATRAKATQAFRARRLAKAAG